MLLSNFTWIGNEALFLKYYYVLLLLSKLKNAKHPGAAQAFIKK
jgi:hypothetical protein